ncbi:MAG: hypothetical protein ACYTG6_00510 [Planctomycetota bacterium]|jgi:hypothetical protein
MQRIGIWIADLPPQTFVEDKSRTVLWIVAALAAAAIVALVVWRRCAGEAGPPEEAEGGNG